MGHHVATIQIQPELLPQIRKVYLSDVSHYTKDHQRERKVMETRKRKLEEKELNLWRAFTDHGMRPQFYERLAKECQAEREKLDGLIEALEAERGEQIANLDAALKIIAEIGDRFDKCTADQQRAILLQMVERVVINPVGTIVRVAWKAPFSYLTELSHDSASGEQKTKRARKARTSGVFAGSLQVSLSAPIGSPGHETLHNFNRVPQASTRFVTRLYHVAQRPTKKQSLQSRNTQIRILYTKGATITELGQKFELSVQRVFQIVNGKHH